jgi:hypothetical protein
MSQLTEMYLYVMITAHQRSPAPSNAMMLHPSIKEKLQDTVNVATQI